MAFNTKEQEIIKWGLSNGKSKQEVEKAITNFRLGITTPKPENKELGYVDRLKESFGERKEEIKDIRDSEASLPEKILQEAGQVAGGAFDIVAEAPGIKQGLDLVGKGISKIPGVQQLGEKAGEAYSKIPERARKNIEAVGNIASLIPVGMGAKGSVVAGEKAVQAGSKAIPIVQEGLEQTFKAGKKILPKSEEIMNRVARLTPTQARKFETLAGKTHGQYLKETGNFGAPDEIVKKEAQKFTQSIKSVDDSLAQLPGKFQEGVVDDILEELEQKALATSTKNVNSPYLVRVKDLIHKNQTEGLTMSEINEAKRLYEKNVKLGYNKLLQGEQIQRATNLDNAVREWQVNKAEELGFTNLKELNKQTQLSKQLINSLGDQVIGKTGLNGVSLTDWIVLSGGDVSSVAGFLTKKFLSSKGVQARIAEWLNDVKVKPMIKPKITPSKPTTQPVLKTQSKSASPNSTTKSLKVKGETPTTNLVAEAKKYKSADEFFNRMNPKLRDSLREQGIKGREQITKLWEDTTGLKSEKGYQMAHRPTETGDFASDITKSGESMPKDFYQHPEYYAQINAKGDYGVATRESLSVLKKIKGKPNTEITIYRASPSEKLNNGDWVTLSKKYAELSREGKETVHSFKVKAKDIQFAGDDINEFGYYPK